MKQSLHFAKVTTLTFCAFVLIFGLACMRRARQFETQQASNSPSVNAARLNINKATAGELERLPGIGRALAERIVDYREQYGPFRRVEHLMGVRGISEAKFRAIETSITVE